MAELNNFTSLHPLVTGNICGYHMYCPNSIGIMDCMVYESMIALTKKSKGEVLRVIKWIYILVTYEYTQIS